MVALDAGPPVDLALSWLRDTRPAPEAGGSPARLLALEEPKPEDAAPEADPEPAVDFAEEAPGPEAPLDANGEERIIPPSERVEES